MRVIGGAFKGIKLKSLRGTATRPTSQRLKKAFFDALSPWIRGSVFLDCFAGSGAVGIEALSRGAKELVFLESEAKAIKTIRQNIELLQAKVAYRIIQENYHPGLKHLSRQNIKFDILFFDPPYQFDYSSLIQVISSLELFVKGALLAMEHFYKEQLSLPEQIFSPFKILAAGDSRISLWKHLSRKP